MFCIAALLAARSLHADTLTVMPGALFGAPGDTVGWSFTITSPAIQDGTHTITPWLLVSNADFIPTPGQFPVGVFMPFITLPQNFQVIGPDTRNGEVNPWSQAFDNLAQTGFGSYTINSFQSPGDAVTGELVLMFDEFRLSPDDPKFNPVVDTIAVGQTATADVSVTVTAGAAEAPEPAVTWSCGLGLCVLGLIGRVRLRAIRRRQPLRQLKTSPQRHLTPP
jgi:hypothetical protein